MTLLKPTELAELKKLAGANLESALMAAARLGIQRISESSESIAWASMMIEHLASVIKRDCFVGKWKDKQFKLEYMKYNHVAKQLRDLLDGKDGE